jgi:hypothetical protein
LPSADDDQLLMGIVSRSLLPASLDRPSIECFTASALALSIGQHPFFAFICMGIQLLARQDSAK